MLLRRVFAVLGLVVGLIALSTTSALAATPTVPLSSCTNQQLSNGSSGSCVKAVQQNLKALGFDLKADGNYGARTRLAVFYFQDWDGLSADGVAGPTTIERLRFVNNDESFTGRGPVPELPDRTARFASDGKSVLVCSTSCTTYLSRASTQSLNDALSDSVNGLKINSAAAVYCAVVGGTTGGVGGVACEAALIGVQFVIADTAQTASEQGACFAIKSGNGGPLAGTTVQFSVNNGHNCIP